MTGNSGKRKIKKSMILALLLACILSCLYSFTKNGSREEDSLGWKRQIGVFLSHAMEQKFFQIPRYLENREEKEDNGKLAERLI